MSKEKEPIYKVRIGYYTAEDLVGGVEIIIPPFVKISAEDLDDEMVRAMLYLIDNLCTDKYRDISKVN